MSKIEFTPEYFRKYPRLSQSIRLFAFCSICLCFSIANHYFEIRKIEIFYGFMFFLGFINSFILYKTHRRTVYLDFKNAVYINKLYDWGDITFLRFIRGFRYIKSFIYTVIAFIPIAICVSSLSRWVAPGNLPRDVLIVYSMYLAVVVYTSPWRSHFKKKS